MTWTPDDALVEKAARAMLFDPDDWDEITPVMRKPLMANARAALIACRDDMVAEAVKAEREKVAKWMIAHSFATGHGDTLDDLLMELELSIREIRARHP